jgi:hypothetical protein
VKSLSRAKSRESEPGAPGLAPFETLNSRGAPDSKQLIPLRLIQSTGTAVKHTLLVFRDIIRVGDSDACSKRISLGFVVAQRQPVLLEVQSRRETESSFLGGKGRRAHSKTCSAVRKLVKDRMAELGVAPTPEGLKVADFWKNSYPRHFPAWNRSRYA